MLGRFICVVALMAIMSACAGRTTDVPSTSAHADSASHVADPDDYSERDYQPAYYGERDYQKERHHHAHRHRDHEHYHDGPTPSEVYAARVAFALSAQVFACAFFVVILDGSCHFYASTGYYY